MKIGVVVLLISAGFYLLVVGFLYFAQESFLFQPKKLEKDHHFAFDESFEEVHLETEDGAFLHALHFKREEPKGVIIYFHGNAGNLERWGEIVQYHVGLNYDVLIMDYRKYGKSEGDWYYEGFLNDAEAIYQYALQQYYEEDIIVYGRSLGTSFASWVASQFKPKKLILEAPFTSVAEMGEFFYPLAPSRWLIKYNFSPVQYLSGVDCPVVIFHGTNDLIVPFELGERLFQAHQASKDISLVVIESGGHNDLITTGKYLY